jgi:glycosyltransferase involved in cell wall biosynthesis
MNRQLSILFTNTWLLDRAGTELVVYELATGLLATGHYPMVYSPRLGRIADDLRASGIPTTDDLDWLPRKPDIIHGHHHVEAMQALLHFPQACGIYVCHDRTAWQDTPPVFNRILRYVAAGLNCRERILIAGPITDDRIAVINNWVQLDRFPCRQDLPSKPKRALVYSNYAEPGGYVESVRKACDACGIALDVIGRFYGNTIDEPGKVLGDYDIVFAVGRSALEAMACGAAVIVCGIRGLGPMVNTGEVEELQAWNFGIRCLRFPLDIDHILEQISRYDRGDAFQVSAYIRREAAFSSALEQYLKLYESVLCEHESRKAAYGDEIGDYLKATVQRLGEYELKVHGLDTTPQWMEALDETESGNVSLRIIEAPRRVKRGSAFNVFAKIHNDTKRTLFSSKPFPVHLAYHWLSPHTKKVRISEGIRTLLCAPVEPGASAVCSIKVIAPEERGWFRLRPALVQERVRWKDGGSLFHFSDRIIFVE